MRRIFAPAALAAVALAILPTLALADSDSDSAQGIDPLTGTIDPANNAADTTFDLGIDVSGVPHDAQSVHSFITGLAPVTQSAVMGACENFMQHPDDIQSPDTYAFCASAVRG